MYVLVSLRAKHGPREDDGNSLDTIFLYVVIWLSKLNDVIKMFPELFQYILAKSLIKSGFSVVI